MTTVADTSSGGSLSGLLQQNVQRLVDKNQGAILTDINRVIDAAGNSVGITIGASDSYAQNATTNVTNAPDAQRSLIGYAAIAAVIALVIWVFLK